MAATFADTILTSASAAVAGAIVRVTPLEADGTDIRAVSAFTDANGDFSLTIPSGVSCFFWVPAAGIHHVYQASAGDVVTLDTVITNGDASGEWDPAWL